MTRRQYTDEYKQHAVQLSYQPGKTVAGVARDLGIPENNLSRWRESYTVDGTPVVRKTGTPPQELQRIKELERELAKVSEERDILKKTIGIFSRSK
jgi:transposase